jgi:alpha-L-fucosidase 2
MYQQLIWEMFDHIQAGWEVSGDSDQAFLASVKNASQYVDKGIHIGSWGQLQGRCAFSIKEGYFAKKKKNLSTLAK